MVVSIKSNGTWVEVPALKGTDGTNGTTPVKGTDYWTAADQSSIVQDVLNALPAAESVSV